MQLTACIQNIKLISYILSWLFFGERQQWSFLDAHARAGASRADLVFDV